MAFCTTCGKEVLPTDKFCLNCGANLERQAPSPSAPFPPSQPYQQPPPSPHSKNPITAALLNLFLPGLGYVYTGIGRDAGEMIFGALVFVFFFIGFDVSVVGNILTTLPTSTSPPPTPVSVSPFEALILLLFLLPFAFAYDGYRRAKQA